MKSQGQTQRHQDRNQEQNNQTSARPTAKAPRRYAFACTNCRRKKIRCDGEQPHCRVCIKAKEACQYPKRSVEVQLMQAQSRIRELENLLETANFSFSGDRMDGSGKTSLESGASIEDSDQEASLLSQVGLDEDGAVTYHGPTSRFHVEPVRMTLQSPKLSAAEIRQKMRGQHLPTLQTNFELLHRVWEPLVRAKTEADFGIDPDLATTLLDIYWTWLHPLHNVVYRPCFVMDMALGGPYFSKFLLMSIFALAARHASDNDPRFKELGRGEKFRAKAKQLLLEELGEKPQIPTIQGLLILGGRQCGVGKSSEGWIYTGMAIRMMTDVGLHLNMQKLIGLEHLTPADLECRKRLYVAAFIWDKTLSLALGRPPTLTRLPHSGDDLIDDLDDEEPWQPVCIDGLQEGYPTMKSYNTMTLKEFCRLGEIVTLILGSMYCRSTPRTHADQLHTLDAKLDHWYQNLPSVLKISDAKKLAYCPPPHILSLNLMYHVLLIILYRPYLITPHPGGPRCPFRERATSICVAQAKKVHDLFTLYGRAFNFKLMTYHVSYCVYTAATVDVQETKSPDRRARDEAAARLGTSLKILEGEARQTPGIRRSIDIIKRQLSTYRGGQQNSFPNGMGSSASALTQQGPTNTPNNDSLSCDQIPMPFAGHTPMEWPPPYGEVTPSNEFSDSPMMQLSDAICIVPDVNSWEFDVMDSGAGFQADATSWSYNSLGLADPGSPGDFSFNGL